MINLYTKLSEKIKEAFNYMNKRISGHSRKMAENNKSQNSGRLYFNGKDMGPVEQIKIETENDNEESGIKLPEIINFECTGTFKIAIPNELKRIANRKIDNTRLFNILRKTRKIRTKKKLAKRILGNYVLNILDKDNMMKRGNPNETFNAHIKEKY